MDTIDEQLDKATACNAELHEQLGAAQSQITALETANAELQESLAHSKDELGKLNASHRAVLEENTALKASAKSAEEKAAEFYGASSAAPARATAKADPQQSTLERFRALDSPTAQTAFIRTLSEAEQAELYSNI